MSLIDKIKLLVKGAKPVGEFVNAVKGARKKYKTIPFWLTIIGSLTSIVAALNGLIPATAAIVATTILTAAYNILRGADKMDQVGVKPPLRSSEFWIGALGIISTAIVDLQTAGVSGQVLTIANLVIGAAMSVAQNLGAIQPDKK